MRIDFILLFLLNNVEHHYRMKSDEGPNKSIQVLCIPSYFFRELEFERDIVDIPFFTLTLNLIIKDKDNILNSNIKVSF